MGNERLFQLWEKTFITSSDNKRKKPASQFACSELKLVFMQRFDDRLILWQKRCLGLENYSKPQAEVGSN